MHLNYLVAAANSTSSTRVTSRPSITTQAHSGEIRIAQGVGGGVGGVIGLAFLVIGVVLLIKRTRLYMKQMEAGIVKMLYTNKLRLPDDDQCPIDENLSRRSLCCTFQSATKQSGGIPCDCSEDNTSRSSARHVWKIFELPPVYKVC